MSEWLVFIQICQIFGLTYGKTSLQMWKRLVFLKNYSYFCSLVGNPVLPKVVLGCLYSFRDTKGKIFHKIYFSRFWAIQPIEAGSSEKWHFSRQMGSEVCMNAGERKNPSNHIILYPIYSLGPIFSFRFDSVCEIWVFEMTYFLLLLVWLSGKWWPDQKSLDFKCPRMCQISFLNC